MHDLAPIQKAVGPFPRSGAMRGTPGTPRGPHRPIEEANPIISNEMKAEKQQEVASLPLKAHGEGLFLPHPGAWRAASLPQPQPFQHHTVALRIHPGEVFQLPPAFANQLEQPHPGVLIMLMLLQVFGQAIDSFG